MNKPGIPFLTAIDSRAAVKGSRDPLGMQQIWVGLGRQVVGNLTTVTGSLRDFTITILGYYFAEQLAIEKGPGHADEYFLKWEQLAAYARFLINKEQGFRGTERVQRNVREENRVRISADSQGQILSDQRTYGLWGLYTVASRSSGLLEGENDRPSPLARELIESLYLPRLQQGAGRGAGRILELLSSPESRLDFKGRDSQLLKAVASVLVPTLTPEERAFYRDHLLFGPDEPTQGRQRQLAHLLESTLGEKDFVLSPSWLNEFRDMALERGEDWMSLAQCLERIGIAETVLAPTSGLFPYLLAFDGQSKQGIVETLRENWGTGLERVDLEAFRGLEQAFEGGDETLPGKRWVEIASALSSGDFDSLVTHLLQQNKAVMQLRGGGSPWAEEQNGLMKIRFRDENGELPDKDLLGESLRFPYFIDSLRAISLALK